MLRLLLKTGLFCFLVNGVTEGSWKLGGRGDPVVNVNDDWEVVRVKRDHLLPPGVDDRVDVSETEVW